MPAAYELNQRPPAAVDEVAKKNPGKIPGFRI
jgi:hypothetical protein